MTKEEKIALAREFFDFGNGGGPLPEFVRKMLEDKLASLADDPAPTLPGDPRALELAREEEHAASIVHDCADMLTAAEYEQEYTRRLEIAAILRRAPASRITLDDVERWMRDAATMAFGDDAPIDFIGLGIVIAAMRKELGGEK